MEKRLIASVTVYNGFAVQSIGFKRYLPIGKPEVVIENLNRQGIDEIVLTDITFAKEKKSGCNSALLRKISSVCFSPVTYAGGIASLEDVSKAITNGADKIAINSNVQNLELISSIVRIYGKQALIISLDFKKKDGKYSLSTHSGTVEIKSDWEKVIESLEKIGVGEYLVKVVDRDGSKIGLDFDLVNKLAKLTRSPILISSGVGKIEHISEAFKNSPAEGVVVGNFLNYFEHSVPLIKSFLHQEKITIRENQNYDKYKEIEFNKEGMLKKYSEFFLEELLFLPPQKVTI